jgi:hypothetical protein
MINFPVKIKKSKKKKKRSLWKNRGQAVKILAPLLKRKAGNLGLILTKTPPALLKK